MSPRLGNAASTTRVAWRLARHEPVAYALTWIGWVTFFTTPLLTGDVTYPTAPLEPPPDGEALLCCAQPATDVVLDL